MGSVGGASGLTTAAVVPQFVAREKQRGQLQRSARARSCGEKERSREHIAWAARGWRARGVVCESQRDVDFVSPWYSCRERMESHVRCIVGVVFIASISRLSISSLRSKPGHFWFAAGEGGVYLCFVGGWGEGSRRRAFEARWADAWMSGQASRRCGAFVGSRGTTRYKAQRGVDEI